MEHSKHLVRIILLLILALIAFHILRTLFTPSSFGRYGHYRADNVQEQMAKPVIHGENISCSQCHADRLAQLRAGAHATVECENCHAPLPTHIKDGEKKDEMFKNASTISCLRCHGQLDARPGGFPQVRLEDHLLKVGAEMGPNVCLQCHEPHDPKLGR
jgi:hypothetical protein